MYGLVSDVHYLGCHFRLGNCCFEFMTSATSSSPALYGATVNFKLLLTYVQLVNNSLKSQPVCGTVICIGYYRKSTVGCINLSFGGSLYAEKPKIAKNDIRQCENRST